MSTYVENSPCFSLSTLPVAFSVILSVNDQEGRTPNPLLVIGKWVMKTCGHSDMGGFNFVSFQELSNTESQSHQGKKRFKSFKIRKQMLFSSSILTYKFLYHVRVLSQYIPRVFEVNNLLDFFFRLGKNIHSKVGRII